MIAVNRLNGAELVVNSDLIFTIEATPDTLLTFTNSNTLLVQQTVSEVIEKIVAWRKVSENGLVIKGKPEHLPEPPGDPLVPVFPEN